MNSMHNILRKQIGQKLGMVNEMPNPFPNPMEEPTPPKHPHHKCRNLQWILKIPMNILFVKNNFKIIQLFDN